MTNSFYGNTHADELAICIMGIHLLAKNESDAFKSNELMNKAKKVEAVLNKNVEAMVTETNNRNSRISNYKRVEAATYLTRAKFDAEKFFKDTDVKDIEPVINSLLKTAYLPFLPKPKQKTVLDEI